MADRPKREVKQQTIQDARDLIGSISQGKQLPDSLRLSSIFDEWLATVELTATDALRCEIDGAVTGLVAMGQIYEDVLHLGTVIGRRKGTSYGPALLSIRNEYIRFIAEAIYTGCDCTDVDGRMSIEGFSRRNR